MTVGPALCAVGLGRSFGARAVVTDLSLTVAPGEIFGLVGPDGAGKTTALRMLAGLVTPSSGTVELDGRNPFADDRVRESLGYLPQQYSLYGDLTVDENLAFFRELLCLPRAAYLERKTRLLALTRLAPFRKRRADALSGGMYKKLALACALLHEPKVLLLDEPTNGVDPLSRRELWDLLHDFVQEGVAIVFATPYMDEAARCHRAGLLMEGRLLEVGTPSELLRGFDHPVFRLQGPRGAVEDYLHDSPDVLAASPAGAELRVVVRKSAVDSVRAELESRGAELLLAQPSFEDLFLARVKLWREKAS